MNYDEQCLECIKAWRKLKEAVYKELEPLIILVLESINKVLVWMVERLR